MHWQDEAIVLSARGHGESAAIVTLLTANHGRHAGLVRGIRSRRGVLQPGNEVSAVWRARLPEHLGTLQVELTAARAAPLLADRGRLLGLSAACAMAEAALPERQPHRAVFDSMRVLLKAFEDEESWPFLYARWELGLLGELGFGLDLACCAATGSESNLIYVSPKTGRAVSAAAGAPYRNRLLRLPPFLVTERERGGVSANDPFVDVCSGFDLCAHFFERHVFTSVRHGMPAARQRLNEWISNASIVTTG